jgi:hypothetical protein
VLQSTVRGKRSNPTKGFCCSNPQFHQNKQKYRINCGIFVYLWSCLVNNFRTDIIEIGREIEEVKRFIGLKNGQTPV